MTSNDAASRTSPASVCVGGRASGAGRAARPALLTMSSGKPARPLTRHRGCLSCATLASNCPSQRVGSASRTWTWTSSDFNASRCRSRGAVRRCGRRGVRPVLPPDERRAAQPGPDAGAGRGLRRAAGRVTTGRQHQHADARAGPPRHRARWSSPSPTAPRPRFATLPVVACTAAPAT